MAAAQGERLCVGVIAGAHGVRGLVKIKSFTEDPANLTAYGALTDESGARRYQVAVTGRAKGVLLARIEGVGDRDAARALRGARLYIARAALPEPEDEEYYHADLIGLAVEDRAGAPLGRVAAVQNFGAGDILEIERPDEGTLLVPFTKAAVPLVDPAGGRVVVEPPEEIEAQRD
ncbi:MAG: ribosome maturation factor RimM [Proteobacteria bacterium]|nr:ribosome maturation factor RimM [Pseudomonadota bacterium]